jgi:hypothetical protein
MPETLAGQLGEEPLHQVQPGAVFRGEHELKTIRPGPEIGVRLPGRVGGVVVEDNLSLDVGGVVRVQPLQELDEFRAPMARADQAQQLPRGEIQARQQAARPLADIFIVPLPGVGLGHPGLGRTVRSCPAQGRHPGLLVVGQPHRRAVMGRVEGQLHLLIDVQDAHHLRVEVGIPAFQIVWDPMRLEVLRLQQFHDRAGHDVRRRGMAAHDGGGPDVRGQEAMGPQFLGLPERPRFLTGEADDPGPVGVRELPGPARPREILERSGGPCGQGLIETPLDLAGRKASLALDRLGALPVGIPKQDVGAFHLAQGRRRRRLSSHARSSGVKINGGLVRGAAIRSTFPGQLPEGYQKGPKMSGLRKPTTRTHRNATPASPQVRTPSK